MEEDRKPDQNQQKQQLIYKVANIGEMKQSFKDQFSLELIS